MTRGQSNQNSDVAQTWFLSGRRVSIEGVDLLLQENEFLKGNPLIVARGQAQAFFLHDENNRVWILKKFLPGRNPNTQYIRAVQGLIPQHPGFESGYQRKVLFQTSVIHSGLPSADFPSWIENTILMPRVSGSDWANIADKVRNGTIHLTPEQRLTICRNLSEKITVLERNNLSHRDLSSTNIFIDTNTWEVHLIDWDSIYHSSLSIPSSTTFGTNGYIAPFVRVAGKDDARATWMRGADRFSMAILNIEFLSVEQNSPMTGDGGLFDQDELYQSRGSGISAIAARFKRKFPNACGLFDQTLRAKNFDECPQPDEWLKLGVGVIAPSLKDVYDPQADFMRYIQEIQKPPTGVPAPKLSDVAEPSLDIPSLVNAATREGTPAPRLAELERVDLNDLNTSANAPARAAPSLSDIEDPFALTNQKPK